MIVAAGIEETLLPVDFYSTSSHISTCTQRTFSDGRAFSECCQGFVAVVVYARRFCLSRVPRRSWRFV